MHCLLSTGGNHCADNPCQNEGNCVDGADDYACNCKLWYYGKNCQYKGTINTCRHQHLHINKLLKFKFLIVNVILDECQLGEDNCSKNATCSDTKTAFICVCKSGYVGNGVKCSMYIFIIY